MSHCQVGSRFAHARFETNTHRQLRDQSPARMSQGFFLPSLPSLACDISQTKWRRWAAERMGMRIMGCACRLMSGPAVNIKHHEFVSSWQWALGCIAELWQQNLYRTVLSLLPCIVLFPFNIVCNSIAVDKCCDALTGTRHFTCFPAFSDRFTEYRIIH